MKKIEFVSSLPGVSDLYPIKYAKDVKSEWIIKAIEDLQNLKNTDIKYKHITKCPGIFDLFKTGYIVSMWYDVYIKTEKEKPGFSWRIADGDLIKNSQMNIIDTHGDKITNHIPVRKGQLKDIVKINTPYQIIAPKNLKFIFLPIAYPDHFDYESTIGILDPSISNELNIQLKWNILEGEILIKAGTPLMQIIPLSNENFDIVCREETQREKMWRDKKRFFNTHTFNTSKIRNKIKDVYERYFK